MAMASIWRTCTMLRLYLSCLSDWVEPGVKTSTSYLVVGRAFVDRVPLMLDADYTSANSLDLLLNHFVRFWPHALSQRFHFVFFGFLNSYSFCLVSLLVDLQGIILEEAKGLRFPLPLGSAAHQQFLFGKFHCLVVKPTALNFITL